MPSEAFRSFEYNLVDTDRIIQTFNSVKKKGAGRGHLTRGGLVLLCASWELYVEMIVRECAAAYTKSLDLPTQLPGSVQQEISAAVRNDKHELRPLHLAGDGWKAVYRTLAEKRTENLNTPKSTKLIPLFSGVVGVPDICVAWRNGIVDLDKFVSARGDIAHRGRHADYLRIAHLQDYRNKIREYAVDTDNYIRSHLKATNKKGVRAWNATK